MFSLVLSEKFDLNKVLLYLKQLKLIFFLIQNRMFTNKFQGKN